MENVLYKILDSLNISFKNKSEMASKTGPLPTDSRKKVVCDYCDKEFERRNLKDHTARMHGKVAVKEKLIGQRTISFGVRAVASVSGGNNNEPAAKKARKDTSETEHSNNPDLNDSLVNYECNDCDYTFDNEMELRRHISTHKERDAVSNEELKQDINNKTIINKPGNSFVRLSTITNIQTDIYLILYDTLHKT